MSKDFRKFEPVKDQRKQKVRNEEAIEAWNRKAGPMGSRNEPRGGSRNWHDYMDEDYDPYNDQ